LFLKEPYSNVRLFFLFKKVSKPLGLCDQGVFLFFRVFDPGINGSGYIIHCP